MDINIKQIPNDKWKENCYVVSNQNKDTLIIDPVFNKGIIYT